MPSPDRFNPHRGKYRFLKDIKECFPESGDTSLATVLSMMQAKGYHKGITMGALRKLSKVKIIDKTIYWIGGA